MKIVFLIIRISILLAATFFASSCAKSDSSKLAARLNLASTPATITLEQCGDIERDGGLMWDCIITTNFDDLKTMMSGHEFKAIRTEPPEYVFIATPKNNKAADWIHIRYNESTQKAAIATHAQ